MSLSGQSSRGMLALRKSQAAELEMYWAYSSLSFWLNTST